MFVFDIVNKLAKDHQAKKASQAKSLNGLHISTKPPLSELWRGPSEPSGSQEIEVTLSGYSRTVGSEALQKASTLGLGYGLGKAVATPDSTPANFGAENNDLLLLLWAPFTSFVAGNLIQNYFFDKMLGSELPKTVVNVPISDFSKLSTEGLKKRVFDTVTDTKDDGSKVIKPGYVEFAINEAKASSFDAVYGPIHALSCAYHGYQRHGEDLLAGLGWMLFGNLGIAAAQGYAKPLRKKAKSYQVEALRPNEQVYAPQGSFKFNTEPQITLVKSNPKKKTSKKKKKPTSTRVLKTTKRMSASPKKSKAKKR